jgi:Tfp pilus assembly protein PilO
MGDAATLLPSLGVVGSLVMVIGYMFRFVSSREAEHKVERDEWRQERDELKRQLASQQETASSRADERARVAEADAERARTRVAELESQLARIANPGDARYARHVEQLEREGRGDER